MISSKGLNTDCISKKHHANYGLLILILKMGIYFIGMRAGIIKGNKIERVGGIIEWSPWA